MRDLENAVHSSERIERLTGNPMLLTTLALVKRKVGKLPSRRHELYREAVDVLLHWRPEIGDLLDREEALPQLQYVAYAMCRDGLTQLRRDQILSHLEDMRAAHANIRPLQKHSPEEFLALLEERTSLLMQAGEVMHHGEPVPVFEFRHLTFQEYLAALALVQGRFPGHTRSTLAERVAPLAGQVSARDPQDEDSVAVSEHWHEPLRLCVGCCNDDDVDDVLRAIATPLSGEDDARTARPRAILAAWCLADEPNASEDAAAQVLQAFARQLRAADRYTSPHHTSLAIDAALALFDSDWAGALESALIEEFIRRAPPERAIAGGLASIAEKRALPADRADMTRWLMDRVTRIEHGTENERIAAALGIMEAACIGRVHMVPRLIEALLALLQRGPAAAHAASWALAWLHEHVDHFGVWHPTDEDVSQLVAFIGQPDSDPEALQWVLAILGRAGSRAAADACIRLLRHPRAPVASAAAYNLAHGDVDLVTGPLLECLKAPVFHNEVLGAAAYALGALGHLPALQRVFDWMNSGDIPGHLAQSVHTGLSDRDANGVTALQRMDGAALADSMLGYLQDTEMSSSVRGVAAWILGELRDARAVEPLLACLSDGASSLELRDDAAFALGHIGDSRAVEPLLACLQDSSPPDDELSRSALTALGRIRDARVIEPLLACLERFAPTSVMNEAVCASIVQTLGLFRDERIIQPLLDRLTVDLRLEAANQKANDEMYPWLPATILQVLAKFDPSRVAPGLQVALQIPGVEPSTRSLLIHALGEMGGFPSAEPLRAMLRDPAEAAEVRAAAARALGRMRYLEAFELLVQYALEHEDVVAPHMPEVEPHKYGPYLGGFYYNTGGSALQLAAVEALSMLDDPRCREPLVRTLRAPSSRARLEALQGLLKMRRDALDSGLVLENIHYTSFLLDPQYTVFSQARMRRQARSLGLPLEEIQRRYEALARDYDLLIEAP
ncbi:MAG TPA: HEAT repeat domain-containing protein [Haliangium sp.]|nr:HEAT repeat domain-containing protein [Haliangium sp.]